LPNRWHERPSLKQVVFLCHFFTFQPELDQAADDLASDGSLDPGRDVGQADDACPDRHIARSLVVENPHRGRDVNRKAHRIVR
jgi:hypothetical protein